MVSFPVQFRYGDDIVLAIIEDRVFISFFSFLSFIFSLVPHVTHTLGYVC